MPGLSSHIPGCLPCPNSWCLASPRICVLPSPHLTTTCQASPHHSSLLPGCVAVASPLPAFPARTRLVAACLLAWMASDRFASTLPACLDMYYHASFSLPPLPAQICLVSACLPAWLRFTRHVYVCLLRHSSHRACLPACMAWSLASACLLACLA